MQGRTLPVAVHMWFAGCEGWAYHPDLSDQFQGALKAIDKYLKSSESTSEFWIPYDHGTIVGAKEPDNDCKDPEPVKRKQFILRFAYLREREPNKQTIELILEQLKHLPLPKERGQCEALVISLPRQPEPPPHDVHEVRSEDQWYEIQNLRNRLDPLERSVENLRAKIDSLTQWCNRLKSECDQAMRLERLWRAASLIAFCFVGLLLMISWLLRGSSVYEIVVAIIVIGIAGVGWYLNRPKQRRRA